MYEYMDPREYVALVKQARSFKERVLSAGGKLGDLWKQYVSPNLFAEVGGVELPTLPVATGLGLGVANLMRGKSFRKGLGRGAMYGALPYLPYYGYQAYKGMRDMPSSEEPEEGGEVGGGGEDPEAALTQADAIKDIMKEDARQRIRDRVAAGQAIGRRLTPEVLEKSFKRMSPGTQDLLRQDESLEEKSYMAPELPENKLFRWHPLVAAATPLVGGDTIRRAERNLAQYMGAPPVHQGIQYTHIDRKNQPIVGAELLRRTFAGLLGHREVSDVWEQYRDVSSDDYTRGKAFLTAKLKEMADKASSRFASRGGSSQQDRLKFFRRLALLNQFKDRLYARPK